MAPKPDANEPVYRGMLDEAVDTLLQGMDKLYERFKGEVDGLRGDIKSRFDIVEDRLQNVETELT